MCIEKQRCCRKKQGLMFTGSGQNGLMIRICGGHGMRHRKKQLLGNWTFYDHDEKYAQEIEKECTGAVVREGLSLPVSYLGSDEGLSAILDAWIQKTGII